MEPSHNGGRRSDTEHITVPLFRWVVFFGVSLLFIGGVALALTAIWRWIF
jgi:hypothetical protein